MDKLKFAIVLLVFFIGLISYGTGRIPKESFTMNNDCPDVLIQKDNKLYLKNTKKAEVPGVNPVEFNNLEEYVDYMKWQRAKGIKCPILYLQHTYNTQGDTEYHVRPGPIDLQGGLMPDTEEKIPISGINITEREAIQKTMDEVQLDRLTFNGPYAETSLLYDSHRDDVPFNMNQYPGLDPHNQYIGLDVPLDRVYRSYKNKEKSPNAMDTHWGGVKYSREVVDSGEFKDRTRSFN